MPQSPFKNLSRDEDDAVCCLSRSHLRACHDVSLTTHATSSRVWQGRARAEQVDSCTIKASKAGAVSAAADDAAGTQEPAGIPDGYMLFLVDFFCGDQW